jgi:hypothetical protein
MYFHQTQQLKCRYCLRACTFLLCCDHCSNALDDSERGYVAGCRLYFRTLAREIGETIAVTHRADDETSLVSVEYYVYESEEEEEEEEEGVMETSVDQYLNPELLATYASVHEHLVPIQPHENVF